MATQNCCWKWILFSKLKDQQNQSQNNEKKAIRNLSQPFAKYNGEMTINQIFSYHKNLLKTRTKLCKSQYFLSKNRLYLFCLFSFNIAEAHYKHSKGKSFNKCSFFSTKHFFLNFNPFPSQCSLFILLKTSENFWGDQNKTLGVNGLKICIDYNPKWIKTLINIYIYKVFRWKNKNYISKKYFDVFSSTVLCFIYINIYIYIYIYI